MLGTPWKGYYLTAYGIAVKHGFVGTEEEWLASLRGEPGAAAELRYNDEEKMIEWRPKGGEDWAAIVPLSELQGTLVAATLSDAQMAAENAGKAKIEAENAAKTAKADAQAAEKAQREIQQNIEAYGTVVKNAYVLGDVLYISTNNGKTFAAGNVRGPKGDAPVRGKDYWTKEDKEEVISAASPMRGVDYWTEADKQGMKEDIEATHAHYYKPADGELLPDKAFSRTIPANQWHVIDGDGVIFEDGVESNEFLIADPGFDLYTYFKVVWNGTEYNATDNDSENDTLLKFTDAEANSEVSILIYDGVSLQDLTPSTSKVLVVNIQNAESAPTEPITLEIIPYTGPYEEQLRQLDPIFIPDYVPKTYVDSTITHRCIPIYGEKTFYDLSESLTENNFNYYDSPGIVYPLEKGKQYAVNWHGKIYICTAEETYFADQDYYVYSIHNEEIEYGKEGYFHFAWTPKYGVFDILYHGHTESCEIMPYSEIVEQLDKKYIPDYISKTEVTEMVGDINAAHDSIIALQNKLIGGDAE